MTLFYRFNPVRNDIEIDIKSTSVRRQFDASTSNRHRFDVDSIIISDWERISTSNRISESHFKESAVCYCKYKFLTSGIIFSHV